MVVAVTVIILLVELNAVQIKMCLEVALCMMSPVINDRFSSCHLKTCFLGCNGCDQLHSC